MIFRNIFKKKNRIVFIFGAPRGGTTWLWSLLESNKGTIPFLDEKTKNKDGTYDSSESGVYIKDAKNAGKKIKSFIKNHKDKMVFEKTPSHTLVYDKILKDFPASNNIVIFRNPIAIVNSMIKSEMEAFKNHDIENSINSVKAYYNKLEELCKIEGNIIITYENLLKETKPVLSGIFQKLNLEVSNIDEIIENNKFKTKVNVKGALRKGTSDSYKEDLSEAENDFIAEQLEYEMRFFERISKLNR
ncbi:sulfotransferase [uncultured Algibacter sp.]|uniref:sulfotransferase n=1 Tax=uncultured Algibacter sp. TaxID=298659 RepID=UPI0026023904|nr:sulfotransferase [uncultured Algibacter sp.]